MNEARGQITAELSLTAKARSAEEVVAQVELRNAGNTPVQLDLWPLRSPSLAIEILDASDQPVRLPPPPVPGGGRELHELPPDGTTRLEYRNFLPPWIERGHYRVRFRYTGVESAWQAVEIGV
ncbi:MAG: hypothetical protein ACREMA_16425 [Longimicrobiales bacterium]